MMNDERIDGIHTRWSVIRLAHDNQKPESVAEARRVLVMRYSSAVRRYIGAIVKDRDNADELSQDVMIRLMKGDFAGANPDRGRFRDLLKTAIRNMVRNHWEKTSRRKGSDTGLEMIADDRNSDLESQWDAAWQRSVLEQAFSRMLGEDGGKPGPGYKLLKLRGEFPDATSEELAERLSESTGTPIRADACRQLLRRSRARFAGHLLDEVRCGLADESDGRVQQELADLGLLEIMQDFLPENE